MKRIFSGAKSPMVNITEEFNDELTSYTIEREDKSSNSTEQDQTSPELVPILTLLSAHLHRRYHKGVLLMLEDLKSDGAPGARKWEEMYAVLIGTQLALWNANDLNGADETTLKNSATKPTYINFTDANIQCIETVKGVSAQNNKKLENILVVSTTLKNRYFLQFSNRESFNQWNVAIRLSLYEFTSLQEAYTGAFISSRGSRLSDIGVLLASKKFDYEEWVNVRFGVGMAWKRCYAVITQNINKKKATFGEINFYESDKKIKKQHSMTTVTHASAIYAVYPSSPKLIDNSTMIKLEGKAKFKGDDTVQETNLFIMPEKHEAVPCYDTIIRFLLPAMNAFRLYGRPKKLIANKDDPISLLFALPTLPHIYYLQLEDLIPLTKSSSCLYWNSSEWTNKIRDILQAKVTKGYSGCGSITSLKNTIGTLFFQSGELFQSSGNILSPLLKSTNGKPDILSSKSNDNKVYQNDNNNNNNNFKSSTSLKSSSSKSLESPLDLDESPSLPKLPININDSKKNVLSGKMSNPSQTPTAQTPEIQRNIMPSTSSHSKVEKSGLTGQVPTNKTVPKNQMIVSETINNQQTPGNSRTEESKTPQHAETPMAYQLEKRDHSPQYRGRYNNATPLTVNTKENDCPSSQKYNPEPPELQHSNFNTFNNQFSVENYNSKHMRVDSSFSFLIDAYREIEDNNNYDHPEFNIKMKQLILSKENTNTPSEHDVFDPEFVEQNQMLEMENVYGSMTSKTQRYAINENNNKEYKQKAFMKQEQTAIHTPSDNNNNNNNNNKQDEDRDRAIAPTITQVNTNNTSNISTQKVTHKKPPPPPPPSGNQQPQWNRGQHPSPVNQQLPRQTSMNINTETADPMVPNSYSMREDPFPNTRVQPVPIQVQVPDGQYSGKPQPLRYNQPLHNTPPTKNYSPVFNQYSPNTQNRPPPLHQYPQPYANNPKIAPRTTTPTTTSATSTTSGNNSNMNRILASQQQQDGYTQKMSYNNIGNNNYTLQKPYPPLNQKFPRANLPQNYRNNQASSSSSYSPNRQFNRYDGTNHNNNNNSNNNNNNNPNNNIAANRHVAPFRPQPPPQQRQFLRPKPAGFSQFMPPLNTDNETNPYDSYATS